MKRIGHCTLCDEPAFEVLRVVDGIPTEIGRPLAGARRVTLVLVDGSRTDLTFCKKCEVSASVLPLIHERSREAWAAQSQRSDVHIPMNERQRWMHGKFNLDQVNNVPLGILFEETWAEAMEREKSR